jgi:hypothetical protein
VVGVEKAHVERRRAAEVSAADRRLAYSQVSHAFLPCANAVAGRVSAAAPNIPIRRRSRRVNVIRHLL